MMNGGLRGGDGGMRWKQCEVEVVVGHWGANGVKVG